MARRRTSTKKTKPNGAAGLIGLGLVVAFLFGRGCQSGQTTGNQATTGPSQPVRAISSGPAEAPPTDAEPASPDAPAKRARRLFAADGTEIATPETWRPASLKLTAPVEMSWAENGTHKGRRMFKIGEIVKLRSIDGDSVYVEAGGSINKIAASSTDLVEQLAAVHTKEPE